MKIHKIMDLIIPTAMAITAASIFFTIHPGMHFLFLPALIVAYVCYILTSYRVMPDSGRVLPVYLLALAVQFLHFTEEYIYGFHVRIAELIGGMLPFPTNTFVAFNMVAYCLLLWVLRNV